MVVVPLPNLRRSTCSMDTALSGKPSCPQTLLPPPQCSTEDSGHGTDMNIYTPPFSLKCSVAYFPEDHTFKLSTGIKKRHHSTVGGCKIQKMNCLCCLVAFQVLWAYGRAVRMTWEKLAFLILHMTLFQKFKSQICVIAKIAGTLQEFFVQTNKKFSWHTKFVYKS